MHILQQNRGALVFLLTFVGLYLILNTLYGLYIDGCYPAVDPATILVAKLSAHMLGAMDPSVHLVIQDGASSVVLQNASTSVLSIFEGCNGINVMIVYLSFLVAFRGRPKQTVLYAAIGILVIYIFNLGRVVALYGVEVYFPQYMYFFHKYLFTGTLYMVVFAMWYFWIRQFGNERA